MILDHLDNHAAYHALHPGFAEAFEFLVNEDLTALPAGRVEVDGSNVFAMVMQREGRGRDAARLEVHRRYIDIQYTVSGIEEIGWTPTRSLTTGDGYNATDDIEFFDDTPWAWAPTAPGAFALFYPHDAHAPLGGTGQIAKVVMKIAVDPE